MPTTIVNAASLKRDEARIPSQGMIFAASTIAFTLVVLLVLALMHEPFAGNLDPDESQTLMGP